MSPRPPNPLRAGPPRSGPIAYFDSGIGGLTVLAEVMKRLPGESSLYIADQLHVPYGGRSLDEIRGFAEALSGFAFSAGSKMVVMACNVSSATYGAEAARRYGEGRVIGVVEPGAAAAADSTIEGRIGVLATEGTVASEAYPRALRRLAPRASVYQVACPKFVPLVESGRADSCEAMEAAEAALAPLLAAKVDTVILGCTHYPFLLPVLERAGPRLRFVDPAVATAIQIEARLGSVQGPAKAAATDGVSHRWLTTGRDEAGFAAAADRFFGGLLQVRPEYGHLGFPQRIPVRSF